MNVPTAIAFIVLCAAVLAAAVATVRIKRSARRTAAAGCNGGCAGCSKYALCGEAVPRADAEGEGAHDGSR